MIKDRKYILMYGVKGRFISENRYNFNNMKNRTYPRNRDIGPAVRVFANGPGFNPRSSHTKDFKNGT